MTQSPTRIASESPSFAGFGQLSVSFYLEQGDVGLGVPPDHFGLIFDSVGGLDADLIGFFDDMVVGEDKPIFTD